MRAEAKSNFLLNEHCWQQSDFTNQVLVVSKVWGHLLLIYRLSWMTERKCMFCMQPCPWCLLFLNQQVLSGVYKAFFIRRNVWTKLVLLRIELSWLLSVKEVNWPLNLPNSQTGLGIFSFDFSDKTSKGSLGRKWLLMSKANRKIPEPLWVSHRPKETTLERNPLKNKITSL